MTNDELQMTKEIRSSKVERRAGVRSAVSSFGFRCSFGFRDSSFGFGDCGSWRAPFRFFACIGTMNCPADVAQASSPASAPGVPPGVRAGGETPLQLAAGTAAIRGSWKASTALMPCIGTMNRLVLVLVVVLYIEAKRPQSRTRTRTTTTTEGTFHGKPSFVFSHAFGPRTAGRPGAGPKAPIKRTHSRRFARF